MISSKDIDQKAAEFAITPIEVEKDYVYSWLLKAIYERPQLAQRLVLKGGQAIRKAYLPNTRFSKDLDFSAAGGLDKEFLAQELHVVCKSVTSATGIRFTDEILTRDKNLAIPGVDAFEARIYFKGFYRQEAINLRAQMDVTQFDRILLPVQSRPLLHPYPDASECVATIQCHKLEEILASKLTTILHRRRCGDLFDLLYSILVSKDYTVSRREVISTFLKKSIFDGSPDIGKGELLSIPVANYEAEWARLIVPSVALLAFPFVAQNFHGLIESLFATLVPVVSTGRLGVSPSVLRGGGGIGGGGGVPAYFPSGVRSLLVNAARNMHLVELVYDGYRRLVEPYKFEYYVRKRDGQGSEYFWGWDTSGGKSGVQGIKMFMCDKIQGVSETLRPYTPRYPVEM
jgi:predicted nucleotidyltransferase component of viral defense system